MPKTMRHEISLEGQYMTEVKHTDTKIMQILAQMDTFRTFCECEQLTMLRMEFLGYYVALRKDHAKRTLIIRYGELKQV